MPTPPAQSGKALPRPVGRSTGLLPPFAAIGLAAVWWASPAQAQSDAACIGYMEADYMYRVAINAAGDVVATTRAKTDDSHSAALDRAETVRAAAMEKSNANLEAAIAEAAKARQIALDRAVNSHAAAMEELTAARDAAFAEAVANLRAAMDKAAAAAASNEVAMDKASADQAAAIEGDLADYEGIVLAAYEDVKRTAINDYNAAIEKAEASLRSERNRASEIFEIAKSQKSAVRDRAMDKAQSTYESAIQDAKDAGRHFVEKYNSKAMEVYNSGKESWAVTWNTRILIKAEAEAIFDETKQHIEEMFELDKREALIAYNRAITKARSAQDAMIKEAMESHKVAVKKANDNYTKAMGNHAKAMDHYAKAANRPTTGFSAAKDKENLEYNTTMRDVGVALEMAKAALKKMASSHDAVKQAAGTAREKAKRKAANSYEVIRVNLATKSAYAAAVEKARKVRDQVKREISVAYEAAIRKADTARSAAQEQAEAVYEETKNEAGAGLWRAYLDAYQGATSKIQSIMERVVAVDVHSCKLKYGDWSSAD